VRTAAVAVLESMRVAPDPRTAGVGSMLIWHFFAWARERVTRQASVTAYAAFHLSLHADRTGTRALSNPYARKVVSVGSAEPSVGSRFGSQETVLRGADSARDSLK
jgi:hypothetical protein